MNDTTRLAELTAAAERAVDELEVLQPAAWTPEEGRRGTSAPWALAEQTARDAVDALQDAATDAIFSRRVVPIGPALLADLEAYVGPTGYRAPKLVELHGLALADHPGLARALRTARVVDLVRTATLRGSHPAGGAEAVTAFVFGVAEQLVGDPEHEPAASALVTHEPALRKRITTAVTRYAEEAVELARMALATWFRKHVRLQPPVTIGSEQLSGAAIADRIEEGDDRFESLARRYYLDRCTPPPGASR